MINSCIDFCYITECDSNCKYEKLMKERQQLRKLFSLLQKIKQLEIELSDCKKQEDNYRNRLDFIDQMSLGCK